MVYQKIITGKNGEQVYIMTASEHDYHRILNDEPVKAISRNTAKDMIADFFDNTVFKNVLTGVSYICEGDDAVITDNIYSTGILDLKDASVNNTLMGDPSEDRGLPSGDVNNKLKGKKIIAVAIKIIPLEKKGAKKFKNKFKSKYRFREAIEEE